MNKNEKDFQFDIADGSKPCKISFSQLNDYLDDELDVVDKVLVEKHLQKCRFCRNQFNQLKQIVDTAMSLSEPNLPDDVSQRLDDCLKDLYKKQ